MYYFLMGTKHHHDTGGGLKIQRRRNTAHLLYFESIKICMLSARAGAQGGSQYSQQNLFSFSIFTIEISQMTKCRKGCIMFFTFLARFRLRGSSPKIIICEVRPRKITRRRIVHRTYTCRVWNTLGCFQRQSRIHKSMRIPWAGWGE